MNTLEAKNGTGRLPSTQALSIACDAHARAKLEKLLGPATVAVENGGVEPKLCLHYRLKMPAESETEQKKLELARQFAAMIVGDNSSSAHLDPKLRRILYHNPGVEIDLNIARGILWQAVRNDGDPRTTAGEKPGLQPGLAQSLASRQDLTNADAREFLQCVVSWPTNDEPGYITIHWQYPEKDGFFGRSCRTIDAVLQVVAELKNTQANIYFCLSSQKLNSGRRSRKNAIALRALWVDIDIDPDDPKKYSTLAEAAANLLWFCDQLGIPRPSFLVASGGGLHAY